MAVCKKCGAELQDNAVTCAQCGAPVESKDATEAINEAVKKGQKVFNELNKTKEITSSLDETDVEENKLWAILSYLAFLCFLPLLVAKDSKFAMYHANQGCVLFIVDVLCGIVCAIISMVPIVGGIVSAVLGLIIFALMILGMYNAVQGRAKELPIIGGIEILK